MKLLQYILLTVILISLSYSCSSSKNIPVTETIAISEYNIYVFRLCEYRNSYGNERYFLCDEPCTTNNVQAVDTTQIIEELYILRSRANPQDIIYITSKSDKYIQRNRGIFNDTLYKKYIMASDFEYVYFGTITNSDKIDFINPTENLLFTYKSESDKCSFMLDSIYCQTAVKNTIRNQQLKISELFKVPIQFLESERKIVVNKKSLDPVKTLQLKDNRMYFNGETKSISLSQRKRLKYHPIYRPIYKSAVRKIISDSLQNQVILKGKAF
ncbi:hypothetical protein [Aequorivita marisscotiae]|uniref:Lipoprotein n=1 Tax=Aequorivita marisscotiae TaxID=3040348 RepID=A0ABY8KXZ4_9FLAO|nr:hypothetical protein [Aequorivita sp. Ant34-E75]WGF92691.1 hypothetical protein QCQ61_00530 [Aequorivita sp. Ant34-E75]